MATSLSLENDSSLAQGYIKVNGTTAATLTTSGITGNLTGNVTGSLTQGGSLTLATAQTASGTAVDFTSIPSWAKRITVMFSGISTSGTSPLLIQIGSGSIDSSGYSSVGTGSDAGGSSINTSTSGYVIRLNSSSNSVSAQMMIYIISSNIYISSHSGSIGTASISGGGTKTLSGILDRLRITTVNGTDTFDAGTINISYEG